MNKTVMTAKEASIDYFENTISYWKLLELAKAGKIPYFKIGSRILFKRESLDNWISDLEKDQIQIKDNKFSDEVKPLKKIPLRV